MKTRTFCCIDEAGRGPLAGSLCIAGVILPLLSSLFFRYYI
ncbi:MAG: hypothetical protein ACXW33_09615 [Sulfuricurvum sp.]